LLVVAVDKPALEKREKDKRRRALRIKRLVLRRAQKRAVRLYQPLEIIDALLYGRVNRLGIDACIL